MERPGGTEMPFWEAPTTCVRLHQLRASNFKRGKERGRKRTYSVDRPIVHTDLLTRDGADGVENNERVGRDAADDFGNGLRVGEDTGGCFVSSSVLCGGNGGRGGRTGVDVGDSDELVLVLLQRLLDRFEGRTSTDGRAELGDGSAIGLEAVGEAIYFGCCQ
jgi:hypothetical protein